MLVTLSVPLHKYRIGVVQLLALVSCSPQKSFAGLYIKFNALLLVESPNKSLSEVYIMLRL